MAINGKSNVVHYGRDITDHKCAEEALNDSCARHELANQSAQMGSWVLDIVENKRDFDAQTVGVPEFPSLLMAKRR